MRNCATGFRPLSTKEGCPLIMMRLLMLGKRLTIGLWQNSFPWSCCHLAPYIWPCCHLAHRLTMGLLVKLLFLLKETFYAYWFFFKKRSWTLKWAVTLRTDYATIFIPQSPEILQGEMINYEINAPRLLLPQTSPASWNASKEMISSLCDPLIAIH